MCPAPPLPTPLPIPDEQKDLPDPDGSGDADSGCHELKQHYSASFEEFWESYPRKTGKRKAFIAWKSACKRATADQICDGARRYAEDPNRTDQFTKYPEGWLNRDGWLDEPIPGTKTAVNWDAL